MPTYEYKCKTCNKKFEEFQSVNDEALKKCIYCDGEVVRVFHPVGIIYKGNGFYTTDYKQKERKRSTPKKAKKQETKKETTCPNKESCKENKACSK